MPYNGAQDDEARGDAGCGLCCALRRGWWRHTSAGGQCGLNRNKRASLRHLRGKTMAAVIRGTLCIVNVQQRSILLSVGLEDATLEFDCALRGDPV